MEDFFGIKSIERGYSTTPARRTMKVEFAEMTEYLNNIRKELNTVYSENNRLRMEIDKLREELRLAKAGAGPTVGPQVTYSTVRPQAHCANYWCRHHQPPR